MGTFRISARLGSGVQGAEQKRIDRAAFADNARLQALFAAGRERVSPRSLAGAAVSVKRSWFLTRLQDQLASYHYFSRSLRALSKIRNSIHAADARTPARLEAAIGDLRKALKCRVWGTAGKDSIRGELKAALDLQRDIGDGLLQEVLSRAGAQEQGFVTRCLSGIEHSQNYIRHGEFDDLQEPIRQDGVQLDALDINLLKGELAQRKFNIAFAFKELGRRPDLGDENRLECFQLALGYLAAVEMHENSSESIFDNHNTVPPGDHTTVEIHDTLRTGEVKDVAALRFFCHEQIGDLKRTEGDFKEARREYERAVKIMRALVEVMGDSDKGRKIEKLQRIRDFSSKVLRFRARLGLERSTVEALSKISAWSILSIIDSRDNSTIGLYKDCMWLYIDAAGRFELAALQVDETAVPENDKKRLMQLRKNLFENALLCCRKAHDYIVKYCNSRFPKENSDKEKVQSHYDKLIESQFMRITSKAKLHQDEKFRTFEGEFKPYLPVRDDVGDAGVAGV